MSQILKAGLHSWTDAFGSLLDVGSPTKPDDCLYGQQALESLLPLFPSAGLTGT